jgi:hypothetical protein
MPCSFVAVLATDGFRHRAPARAVTTAAPKANTNGPRPAASGGQDSAGTRAEDLNRFTADDLVAVSFLSVDIRPAAARKLLDTEAAMFSELLVELGPDRDLVEETHPWEDDWVGWRLWSALRALPDVGPTRASKLYARKRPRLRPIYDTVVERVIGQTRCAPSCRQTRGSTHAWSGCARGPSCPRRCLPCGSSTCSPGWRARTGTPAPGRRQPDAPATGVGVDARGRRGHGHPVTFRANTGESELLEHVPVAGSASPTMSRA